MTSRNLTVLFCLISLLWANSNQADWFGSNSGVYGGGNTTRRTGKQAVQDDSVYCQQTPEGQVIPKPYGGTRRNIPCGLPGSNVPNPIPEPAPLPTEETCDCQAGGDSPGRASRSALSPGSDASGQSRSVALKASATCSCDDRLCSLKDLAALVNERYGTGHPVATIRLMDNSGSSSYLLLLQGMDEREVVFTDAVQAYLRNSAAPELRVVENILRAGNGDRYRAAVVDAVEQLPDGAQLMIAGHSLGGIETQNIVGALASMRPDIQVPLAVSFGAPVVGHRQHGPRYLDVKATKGVPDLVASFALDRGVSLGIIPINGDSSIDLHDTRHGSHYVYWKSPELAQLGLDGRPLSGRSCLALDVGSLQSYGLGNGTKSGRWSACPDTSFSGHRPDQVTNLFQGAGDSAWKNQQARAWRNATTVKARNRISEEIGEAAMEKLAASLGYTEELGPNNAGSAPQGFDAVYRDKDGTLIVAEAKGGYNGQGLDDILGYGYRCRQGTIEWVRRATERILTAGTTTPKEQRVAQELRSRIMSRAFRVRVEVFHTEHNGGVAGVTRHYVTASSP